MIFHTVEIERLYVDLKWKVSNIIIKCYKSVFAFCYQSVCSCFNDGIAIDSRVIDRIIWIYNYAC